MLGWRNNDASMREYFNRTRSSWTCTSEQKDGCRVSVNRMQRWGPRLMNKSGINAYFFLLAWKNSTMIMSDEMHPGRVNVAAWVSLFDCDTFVILNFSVGKNAGIYERTSWKTQRVVDVLKPS
jgi:hypothetical protein